MKHPLLKILTTSVVIASVLALGACAAEQAPPVAEAGTPSPSADSVSFRDGGTLPPEADVAWGDGFAQDEGWEEVEHLTEPGRWLYLNTDETCSAAFRSGPLGEAGDMDDQDATDAVIAAALNTELTEIEGSIDDGYFLRHGPGEAQVAHRQFSFTVDGGGSFIAARAFVELNYSVAVTVMCEGADVRAVAEEVLSKNTISVETAVRN